MAPAPDEFSAPGSVSYDSDTLTVGDGTWEFSKNTFLLPNLMGTNFETTRYNGMGNRFSTVKQYHTIITAHGVLATIVFLFLLPTSIMMARFFSQRPGYAVRYHAQINIFAGLLLLVVFILPFFAVGPKRSLTNPHHGIGVALFVLFIVQLLFGRIVRHITKIRSLRITLHQWLGRSIALLGIVQVPLGLTLYGSPKYLFVLYALWMSFLVLLYFILSYRAEGRREMYMSGGRSEVGGRSRITESEYFSDHRPEHSSRWKWLGPLAAGAGIFAWLRGRKKHDRDGSRGRSRSHSPGRRSEVISSRRGSASYLESEKYSDLPRQRKGGAGIMKYLGGAAAALGAGKLVSGLMNRREQKYDDEYSAVSTETPRRHRPGRSSANYSEFDSEMTPDLRRSGVRPDETQTSLLPPSAYPAAAAAGAAASSRRPITPPPSHGRARHDDGGFEESEYSSYVSPSRRPPEERPGGGGLAKGIMAGLGMGWFSKKLAERRRRKEDARLDEEEEMRAGNMGSRFTGDGHPSPTRRNSRRPPMGRRPTGYADDSVLSSELTESTVDTRPPGGQYAPPQPPAHGVPPVMIPGHGGHSRSRSDSRHRVEPVEMPGMPSDPQGILASGGESSFVSEASRPQRRGSSRRRRAGERAAAAAAARASDLAAREDRTHRSDRDNYGSPQGRPVSVKLKMHDDKDRNVTLRRLTDEEARAARGPRSRAGSESSLSAMDSPSYGRNTYRRDSSQRRAERAAERAAERRAEEQDNLAPLSPPNPAFAKGARRQKDSAYYSGQSGQAGPSGGSPAAGQTMSSLGSMASPTSHVTWSEMSHSPSGGEKTAGGGSVSAAADNRRRRRLERRRGSSARPSGADMFD